MRLLLAGTWIALGLACATHHQKGPLKTEVVTFPDGAIVEFNGKPVGRAPTAVVLPQDSNGKLLERVTLRALPNTRQDMLFAQTRTLEPSSRDERVPNRIMIDMRVHDTNTLAGSKATVEAVNTSWKTNKTIRSRPADRSKPTQPVGIDRWNPGIY